MSATDIFMVVYVTAYIIIFFILIITRMVFKFRGKVIKLEYEHNARKIDRREQLRDIMKFYNALPSPEKMIWSFKRVRLESYYSKAIIDELMS